MAAKIVLLLLFVCLLVACGGGAPYVGQWQCEADASSTLEIARFEEYFLVTARHGGDEIVREGIYENDAFAVGSNSVGQAMQFELTDGKLVCTKPPNFCRCDSAFRSVDGSTIESRPPARETEAPAQSPQATGSPPVPGIQLLRVQQPLPLQLDNGGTILLFDDYRNEDIEQRMFDWPKLTYYYLPQLKLLPWADGRYAEVREREGQTVVVFNLSLGKFDRFELMERVHASINQKILPDHVIPLDYERVFAGLSSDTPGVSFGQVQLAFESGGQAEVAVSVEGQAGPATLSIAEAIAGEINNGSALPRVAVEINQTSASGETLQPEYQKVMHDWPVVRTPHH